jgi:hypothetical protein
MKRLALALLGCGALLATSAAAQTETDDIELARTHIATERKAIVAKNMELSEEQSDAFWPVYNEFQEAKRDVSDRRVKLIQEYAEKYGTLSEDHAIKMLKEMLDIGEDELEVQKEFVRKFEKVLPAMKVFRYYQIESKLDAVVEYELARSIPLVE